MKEKNSKEGQLSVLDLQKLALLVVSFLGGFYLANMEIINILLGQYIKPEWLGIATAFLAYFFKLLMKDNTK